MEKEGKVTTTTTEDPVAARKEVADVKAGDGVGKGSDAVAKAGDAVSEVKPAGVATMSEKEEPKEQF